MANGYVRFRPPMRGGLPFPPRPPMPPANADPNALFQRPKPAFCAFPDDGPNIFQQGFAAVVRWLAAGPTSVQQSFMAVGSIQRDVLTEALWENSWSIFIGLACVVVMSLLAWFFSPKGETQTIWRSTLILTFASCYIMWAITFLAQWHPLIEPRMGTFRGSADWSGAELK